MSIRISLDNAPEFYTNLDLVTGRIILVLNRPETIGAIIVKFEGESRTVLEMSRDDDLYRPAVPAGLTQENHKLLYKVQQVFPGVGVGHVVAQQLLQPGQHAFPFKFKVPFNNACSDPASMAKIGGFAGAGGFGAGPSLFGMGGIRVMDGSRQLMYRHITKTLPPSFTGSPGVAEIRYFVKVTIQRPGLFKENWRYQAGLKFMPIEPPRPERSNQEAYARRPFAFRPKSPGLANVAKKRSSFFGHSKPDSSSTTNLPNGEKAAVPPSIEMSARLPHPSILTCNKAIPLRLIAKRLNSSREPVFLTSLQMDLIGNTHIRSQDQAKTEKQRWVVANHHSLNIPLTATSDSSGDTTGDEMTVPDHLWRDQPLPNTVMPSFQTCNLSRSYELEVKLGLSWGKPSGGASTVGSLLGKGKDASSLQTLFLPLHFSHVDVYSGVAPPPEVARMATQRRSQRAAAAAAAAAQRPGTATAAGAPGRTGGVHRPRTTSSQSTPATPSSRPPPQLPPRSSQTNLHLAYGRPPPGPQQAAAAAAIDPLYPPQLLPGQLPHDDAPPSYDEAMAEAPAGPVTERPAYSGVTNENAASSLPPEKGG